MDETTVPPGETWKPEAADAFIEQAVELFPGSVEIEAPEE
jgi:hypothetical protein